MKIALKFMNLLKHSIAQSALNYSRFFSSILKRFLLTFYGYLCRKGKSLCLFIRQETLPAYIILGHEFYLFDEIIPQLYPSNDDSQGKQCVSIKRYRRMTMMQKTIFINLQKRDGYSFEKQLRLIQKMAVWLLKRKRQFDITSIIMTISISKYMQLDLDEKSNYINNLKQEVEALKGKTNTLSWYLLITDVHMIEGADLYLTPPINVKSLYQHKISQLEDEKKSIKKLGELFGRCIYDFFNITLSQLILSEDKIKVSLQTILFPYAVFRSCETLFFDLEHAFNESYHPVDLQLQGIHFLDAGSLKRSSQRPLFSLKALFDFFMDKMDKRKEAARMLRYKVLSRFVFFIILNMFLLFGISLVGAYHEQTFFHQKLLTVTDLLQRDSHLSQSKQIIDAIKLSYEYLERRQRTAWIKRIGIFNLGWFDLHYHQMLDKTIDKRFSDTLTNTIISKLREYSTTWHHFSKKQRDNNRAQYYELFKLYLMMLKPNTMDATTGSEDVFTLHSKLGINKDIARYYLQHISHVTKIDVNRKLINKMRDDLYIKPIILNEYALLRERFYQKLGNMSKLDLVNGSNPLKARDIPILYSKQGWARVVKIEIDKLIEHCQRGAWLFYDSLYDDGYITKIDSNSCVNTTQLKSYLYSMYFDEYLHVWLSFLKDIQLQSIESTPALVRQLHLLNQVNSPLDKLFDYVKEEVSLKDSDLSSSSMITLSAEYKTLFSYLSRLSFLPEYKKSLLTIEKQLGKIIESDGIEQAYREEMKKLLNGQEGESWLGQSYMSIKKIVDTNNMHGQLRWRFLYAPIYQVWDMFAVVNRQFLQKAWSEHVYQTFQFSIQNKYPFSQTEDEVTFVDFREFYQPSVGVFDNFYRDALSSFLILDENSIKEKTWLSQHLDFTETYKASLLATNRIIRGLSQFEQFQFQFQVKVIPSQGIKDILLEMDGTQLTYENGPERWHTLTWRHMIGTSGALLQLVPIKGDNIQIEKHGIWGIFRLIDKAHITRLSKEMFQADWVLKEGKRRYPLTILFRDVSHYHPLNQLVFRELKQPSRIFKQTALSSSRGISMR